MDFKLFLKIIKSKNISPKNKIKFILGEYYDETNY